MLKVRIGNLELDIPIVAASGTFGFGQELKGLVDFKYIGAIITKTITKNPRAGNYPPRIYETEYGVINSVGLENPGLDGFIKDKLPELDKLATKYIVSVGGFFLEEYEYMVRKLNKYKTIKALEINLSCPNLKLKKMISQSKSLTSSLIKSLRKLTKKTLIVKITPEVTDMVDIAKAVELAGADAISLVNTFLAMAINIDTRKPYLGNGYGGYSGKAIKPLSLYRVWKVANQVNIPIIGGGGIEDAKDAIEFFLAGAGVVSLGTINLVYPNQAKLIATGIQDYLIKHKITDIKKIGLLE